MKGFVNDDVTLALRRAVEAIEGVSGVEIVIAIRRQSSDWLHANLIVGGAAAVATLAFLLFSSGVYSNWSLLIDPVVAGLAVGAFVELVPGLKRWLSSRSWRRRVVMAAAKATFYDRGVHLTQSRAGLLVYVSVLERTAVVVGDRAVVAAVAPAELESLRVDLERATHHHGEAIAAALTARSALFSASLPRHAHDENELPDVPSSLVSRWMFGERQ
ncbi:MAG: hypothetical protein IPL79_00965 [Myxococcales bacterium]|nr:hypothetical protein [Myxococcales bacterium]